MEKKKKEELNPWDIWELYLGPGIREYILGYIYLKGQARLAEIAKFFNRTKPSVFSVLKTLEERKLIFQDGYYWKVTERGKKVFELIEEARKLLEAEESEPKVETFKVVEAKEGEEALK